MSDIDLIRAGIGSGDMLVPGTMSEQAHVAFIALDRLAARVKELEAQIDALDAEAERAAIVIQAARVVDILSAAQPIDYDALWSSCETLHESLKRNGFLLPAALSSPETNG